MGDILRLKYLLEVIDRGGFTNAAASLGIAQSALSRHVKELERHYGQPFLHRTGRGVVPTALVERFLPRMRALVCEAERLSEDMLEARGGVVGHVRLGITQTLSGQVLTPLFREIAELHPGLKISVREGLSDHIDQALATADVDLGILYARLGDMRDDDESFMTIDFVLAGPFDDPFLARSTCTLKEASKLPLILAGSSNRWRSDIEQIFFANGLNLNITFECDSFQAIKDFVQLPGNYSIVSPHLIHRETEAGLIATCRIVDPPIRRRMIIRHSPHKAMGRSCRLIADILRRQVREHTMSGRLPAEHCEDDRP